MTAPNGKGSQNNKIGFPWTGKIPFPKVKKLNGGTVPPFKTHPRGTVPPFKVHL